MTIEELDKWADDFESFHARFADLFARSEPREQAAKYMRGLMASVERKNGWQLAEAIGDRVPDPTQRLLYKAKWEADEARDRLQQFVGEIFWIDASTCPGNGATMRSGALKPKFLTMSSSRPSRNKRLRCWNTPGRRVYPCAG